MIEESLLQAAEITGLAETFHRANRPSRDLGHRHHASAHLAIVKQHRAGTAIAGIAADLGSGQTEILAQNIRQSSQRINGKFYRSMVDGESEFDNGHWHSSFKRRRNSVSAASRR